MGLNPDQEKVVRDLINQGVDKAHKDFIQSSRPQHHLPAFIDEQLKIIKDKVLDLCVKHSELRGVDDLHFNDFIDEELGTIQRSLLFNQVTAPGGRNSGASLASRPVESGGGAAATPAAVLDPSSRPDQRGGGAAALLDAPINEAWVTEQPLGIGLDWEQGGVVKELFEARFEQELRSIQERLENQDSELLEKLKNRKAFIDETKEKIKQDVIRDSKSEPKLRDCRYDDMAHHIDIELSVVDRDIRLQKAITLPGGNPIPRAGLPFEVRVAAAPDALIQPPGIGLKSDQESLVKSFVFARFQRERKSIQARLANQDPELLEKLKNRQAFIDETKAKIKEDVISDCYKHSRLMQCRIDILIYYIDMQFSLYKSDEFILPAGNSIPRADLHLEVRGGGAAPDAPTQPQGTPQPAGLNEQQQRKIREVMKKFIDHEKRVFAQMTNPNSKAPQPVSPDFLKSKMEEIEKTLMSSWRRLDEFKDVVVDEKDVEEFIKAEFKNQMREIQQEIAAQLEMHREHISPGASPGPDQRGGGAAAAPVAAVLDPAPRPDQRGGGAAAAPAAAAGPEEELREPDVNLSVEQRFELRALFSMDAPEIMGTREFSQLLPAALGASPQAALASQLPDALLARCILNIESHLRSSDRQYSRNVAGIPEEIRVHIDSIRECYRELFPTELLRHDFAVKKLNLNKRRDPGQLDVTDEDVRKYLHYLIKVKIKAAIQNANELGVSFEEIQAVLPAAAAAESSEGDGVEQEQEPDRISDEYMSRIQVYAGAQSCHNVTARGSVELVFSDETAAASGLQKLRGLTGRDRGLIRTGMSITIPREHVETLADRISWIQEGILRRLERPLGEDGGRARRRVHVVRDPQAFLQLLERLRRADPHRPRHR